MTADATPPRWDVSEYFPAVDSPEFRAAVEALAARVAHLVLDRTEVPALDRLLQALTAADIDGLERILDDRLTSHIETLLSA